MMNLKFVIFGFVALSSHKANAGPIDTIEERSNSLQNNANMNGMEMEDSKEQPMIDSRSPNEKLYGSIEAVLIAEKEFQLPDDAKRKFIIDTNALFQRKNNLGTTIEWRLKDTKVITHKWNLDKLGLDSVKEWTDNSGLSANVHLFVTDYSDFHGKVSKIGGLCSYTKSNRIAMIGSGDSAYSAMEFAKTFLRLVGIGQTCIDSTMVTGAQTIWSDCVAKGFKRFHETEGQEKGQFCLGTEPNLPPPSNPAEVECQDKSSASYCQGESYEEKICNDPKLKLKCKKTCKVC